MVRLWFCFQLTKERTHLQTHLSFVMICLDTLRKRAWPKLVGLFGLYHESDAKKRLRARTTAPLQSLESTTITSENEYSGSVMEIDASLLTGRNQQAPFDSE